MNEVLTRDEIYERYPDEWILLADPETDAGQAILRGAVLCHSKERDAVYGFAKRARPAHFAVLYTGRIPEGAAVLL